MSRIFISYRREDASGHAGRLSDDLIGEFGPDGVFIDVDTIRPGADFVDVVERAITSCDAVLAVIGRRWLTVTDAGGQRRLDDPNDWVRLEVSTALRREIPVIPVLVDGATMPSARSLPRPLARLARRQALEISDNRWRSDVAHLIRVLRNVTSSAAEALVKANGESGSGGAGEPGSGGAAGAAIAGGQLEELYTQALTHFYLREWSAAVEILRVIVARQPTYEDAANKLEEATRQQRLTQRYGEGVAAAEAGSWGTAVERFTEVLALDDGYRDAAARLAEARRQQTLAGYYEEARRLHRAQQWPAVAAVFERIAGVDPDYPDPNGLLASAREALAGAERERQLAELYAQGLRQMDARAWREAVSTFERVLAVDPSYRASAGLLERVRQELGAETRGDGAAGAGVLDGEVEGGGDGGTAERDGVVADEGGVERGRDGAGRRELVEPELVPAAGGGGAARVGLLMGGAWGLAYLVGLGIPIKAELYEDFLWARAHDLAMWVLGDSGGIGLFEFVIGQVVACVIGGGLSGLVLRQAWPAMTGQQVGTIVRGWVLGAVLGWGLALLTPITIATRMRARLGEGQGLVLMLACAFLAVGVGGWAVARVARELGRAAAPERRRAIVLGWCGGAIAATAAAVAMLISTRDPEQLASLIAPTAAGLLLGAIGGYTTMRATRVAGSGEGETSAPLAL